MLETARLFGLQINIKKQAHRTGVFTEGKGIKKSLKSGMYSVDYSPSDDTVIKMQH